MRTVRFLPAVLALALFSLGCNKSTQKPVAAIPPTTPTTAAKVEVAKAMPYESEPLSEPIEPPQALLPTELPLDGSVQLPVNPGLEDPSPALVTAPMPQPVPETPIAAQVPAAPAPAPQPPVATQPPTPPATTPTEPITPKKIEYPKQIDGRTLAEWLKDLSYYPSTYGPVQTDPQSREIAIKVLPNFGPSARKPALNPLINVVNFDSDPGVRIAAITVISNMGYDEEAKDKESLMAKPAVSALKTRMRNTAAGSLERLYCVKSLAAFNYDAASSIGDLQRITNDPSYEVRTAIAAALGRVGMAPDQSGEANKVAAQTLLEVLLHDSCASVRMETIQSLMILGPPNPKTGTAEQKKAEYIKEVAFYLKSVNSRIKPEMGAKGEKDQNVLCWLMILQIMYDGTTLDANVKALAAIVKAPTGKNPDNIRMNAINCLAVLGPKAVGALDAVIDMLQYQDIYVVAAAISCLAPMGTAAVRAVPELEKIAKGSRDPEKPKDAPVDWKPDHTMRKLAAEAILYVKGEKKLGDAPMPKEVTPKN